MCPVFLKHQLREFEEVCVEGEAINAGLVSLVPCHKAWFKHPLCDIADYFGVGLPIVFLVTFAC